MLIILPTDNSRMDSVIKDLPYDYDDIVASLQETEVQVYLPRFGIEYYEDLVRNLEEVNLSLLI